MGIYLTLFAALRILIGRSISAVKFVEGYVQIEFQNSRMSALADLQLTLNNSEIRSGEKEFPDRLRNCIGNTVLDVIEASDYFIIRLTNGMLLKINLTDASSSGETFIYDDDSGQTWVV